MIEIPMSEDELVKTLEESFEECGLVSKDEMETYVAKRIKKAREDAIPKVPKDLERTTQLIAESTGKPYSEVAKITVEHADGIRQIRRDARRDANLVRKQSTVSDVILDRFYNDDEEPEIVEKEGSTTSPALELWDESR